MGTWTIVYILRTWGWGGLERIVIVKLYQYVCVRAVPIFKMINCMKFYLYICMRFRCRTNSEKLCDYLLLSFYKTCSCCWKVVFLLFLYIFERLFGCVCTVWMYTCMRLWNQANDRFILSIQNHFICLKVYIFILSQ